MPEVGHTISARAEIRTRGFRKKSSDLKSDALSLARLPGQKMMQTYKSMYSQIYLLFRKNEREGHCRIKIF
jgi:hypothetical protein